MTKGIYITGTDTDIGKTAVSAGLMYLLRNNGYNAVYFKAALSGAIEENGKLIPGDTRFACELSGLKEEYNNITPYIYKTAVSPHLAAKIENKPIDLNVIKDKFNKMKEKYDYVLAEGSGGIVCPLIDDKDNTYMLYDLIKELGMNVIVVARASLGTINHTVITVKYIESLGIKVKGIIINGYKENELYEKDNIEMIKKLTKIPILGVIPWIKGLDAENVEIKSLKEEMEKAVNVDELVKVMDEI